MKVSSASTTPLKRCGLSAAGAPRNRSRRRKAVGRMNAAKRGRFRQALPSIIARAWSSQRFLLRRRAIGVLVSALKVRPQALQRNRATRAAPPSDDLPTREWGQPRASTRSWPLAPSASGRRLRLADPASFRLGLRIGFAPAPIHRQQRRNRLPPLRLAQPRDPRKPNRKVLCPPFHLWRGVSRPCGRRRAGLVVERDQRDFSLKN